MSFPFNVYAATFAAALLASLASLPVWRAWCHARGHVDDPGHRKIHSRPIPLAGGIAVFTGMALPVLAATIAWIAGWFTDHPGFFIREGGLLDPATARWFAEGLERRTTQLAAFLLGAVGMLLLGWLDDRHELHPAIKFAGQTVIAAGIALAGIRITLFVDNLLFSYAITVLWILTITNACNFMDNMNGLCTGLGIVATWCFAWSAAVQGQFLVAAISFLTCGALLGFLPFNFPRASAFLGDAGSHLVGYLLALLAILPQFYSAQNPAPLAVLKPLLILGIILGDLVWVVLFRWHHRRPIYLGDTNHVSHRLVRLGLSPTRAVLLILLLASVLGTIALLA